ncbi:Fic family protein [Thalassococcus lentus]|uniref:Helix-turn-helix domain-containing protein n=1 Tax=Thalassococcus lentus TaxID=1210524 RepID=A0ABT4XUC1_9RHOB|nr:hypothetical protein [Thalassococcus lentus]MDA7425573.1 hypothetical protein [Thalassococcus lentus]
MGRDKRNEQRGGRFARYPAEIIESVAWLSLSGYAVKLHLVLIQRQFGSSDELAAMSENEACKALGLGSRQTARNAFKQLVDAGFIVLQVPAHLGSNGYGRAAKYRLTHLRYNSKPPTRDWVEKTKTPHRK